jgi:endonuclease/exonuclease/phosphatase family metal-dependent hydrolase
LRVKDRVARAAAKALEPNADLPVLCRPVYDALRRSASVVSILRRLKLPYGVAIALVAMLCLQLPPASAARVAARDVRVATFNIYKGANVRNQYNLSGTIEALAGLGADVVGLQEVLRNHPHFNCDDQPQMIAEGLRHVTGRPWHVVFQGGWFGPNRECMDRGRGDNVETEGLAFVTPHRILESQYVRLPEYRIGLMIRLELMPAVPLIETHLASTPRNQPLRIAQLAALLPWAQKHGPNILLGDLNAAPTASELASLFATYRDAWQEAQRGGAIRGVLSGETEIGANHRIDYVLLHRALPLSVKSATVPKTGSARQVEASDHRPLVATLQVKEPAADARQ